jgi:hypothetical protein
MWPAFPAPSTTTRSDCRSAAPPLPGFAGYRRASLPDAPQAPAPRRLSRAPRTTIRTFNTQYAGGFLGARSWTKSASRGLRRGRTGSAPSPAPTGRVCLTTLARASPALQTARSRPPRFAPGLSTTHGSFATGDPGVSPNRTRTGRPPRTCRSLCHAGLLPPWHRAVSAHPSISVVMPTSSRALQTLALLAFASPCRAIRCLAERASRAPGPTTDLRLVRSRRRDRRRACPLGRLHCRRCEDSRPIAVFGLRVSPGPATGSGKLGPRSRGSWRAWPSRLRRLAARPHHRPWRSRERRRRR